MIDGWGLKKKKCLPCGPSCNVFLLQIFMKWRCFRCHKKHPPNSPLRSHPLGFPPCNSSFYPLLFSPVIPPQFSLLLNKLLSFPRFSPLFLPFLPLFHVILNCLGFVYFTSLLSPKSEHLEFYVRYLAKSSSFLSVGIFYVQAIGKKV